MKSKSDFTSKNSVLRLCTEFFGHYLLFIVTALAFAIFCTSYLIYMRAIVSSRPKLKIMESTKTFVLYFLFTLWTFAFAYLFSVTSYTFSIRSIFWPVYMFTSCPSFFPYVFFIVTRSTFPIFCIHRFIRVRAGISFVFCQVIVLLAKPLGIRRSITF